MSITRMVAAKAMRPSTAEPTRHDEESWKRCGGRSPERGFTLLEVALYCALALILGAPLVSVALVSSRSTRENDAFNAIVERNRTALLRVEREVRRCIGSTITIGDAGATLSLTTPAGFDGSAIVPGASLSFLLRPVAGEELNGSDDNNNGMADEGELVRRVVATGAESLIAPYIDVARSGFAFSGTGVTVTITSFGAVKEGTPFSISKSVTVNPRN